MDAKASSLKGELDRRKAAIGYDFVRWYYLSWLC
jgi:hypothetical protein